MNSIKDFKELIDADLVQKESDLREELFNLRFQKKVGQLENPLSMRAVRRDIAKVKTLLNIKKTEKDGKVGLEG